MERIANTKCGTITEDCSTRQLPTITLSTQLDGAPTETTLPWEHLECSRYATRQAGHTLSAKYKTDQFKNLRGRRMVLSALDLVETEMLFLVRLWTSKYLTITGKPT